MTRPRYGVGGSDVAAIVGLDPRRTPYQLWRQKLGLDKPDGPTPATLRGQFLEPYLIDAWRKDHGPAEMQEQVYAESDNPSPSDGAPGCGVWRFGTLDALAIMPDGQQRIVEAKTVSRHVYQQTWGAPWSDEVPDRALCQGLWYWSLVPTAHVIDYVVAVMPDDPDEVLGLSAPEVVEQCQVHYYRVIPDAEAVRLLLTAARDFWASVRARVAPALRTIDDVKLQWPRGVAGKVRVATDEVADLIDRYEALGDLARGAEKDREAVKVRLLEFAQDCEAIVGPDGKTPWLTAGSVERKGYTVEPSTVRQVRVTKWWRKSGQQAQEIPL